MHIIWLGEELPQAFVLGMALKTSNDGIAEGGMIFMSILFVEGGALRAPYIPNNIDHKKAPFWGANTKKLFFFWGGGQPTDGVLLPGGGVQDDQQGHEAHSEGLEKTKNAKVIK